MALIPANLLLQTDAVALSLGLSEGPDLHNCLHGHGQCRWFEPLVLRSLGGGRMHCNLELLPAVSLQATIPMLKKLSQLPITQRVKSKSTN